MAKKEKFYSSYENKEIEEILQRSDKKPIVLYYDQANQLYRLFATEERRDAWVAAYTAGEMTDEISKYEFTESFTAPAPYTINFISLKDNQYILNGTVGTILEYGFITVDGNGQEVQEAIDAYYTFKTPSGTKQTSNVYNADTTVRMNIDDFLSIGTNSITILIRGRSTGVTKTIVVTYYVVELSLTSNFNIAKHSAEYELLRPVHGRRSAGQEHQVLYRRRAFRHNDGFVSRSRSDENPVDRQLEGRDKARKAYPSAPG